MCVFLQPATPPAPYHFVSSRRPVVLHFVTLGTKRVGTRPVRTLLEGATMPHTHGETRYETSARLGEVTGAPAAFEEAYLRFAPLLRKIAVSKFGIPLAGAEPAAHAAAAHRV